MSISNINGHKKRSEGYLLEVLVVTERIVYAFLWH